MSTLLYLTYRMQAGFGVDVVVANLAQQLLPLGTRVVVGCLEDDGSYPHIPTHTLKPTLEAVTALAEQVQPDAIVAHTTPFFELLPQLQRRWPCWAWEHGDPSPEFFDHDIAERQRIKEHKQQHVYPAITGVIAISHFIRADIGHPAAQVIYNGCDHAPAVPAKGQQDLSMSPRKPLKVGTLMRLGTGEARYKGNALFCDFAEQARAAGVNAEFCVMGRGTAQDAKAFRRAGMQVHLNASAEEKWRYLRELDVFISCSQWEGCNLPLVEAESQGTLGLALDTGAHPEVTPFVMSSLGDALSLVQRCAEDRALLLRHSRTAWHFVRQRFTWHQAALHTQALLLRASAA